MTVCVRGLLLVALGLSALAGSAPSRSGTSLGQADRRGAAHLHTLLAKLEVPPPYVLAGHSWGGPIIHVFAATYPKEIAGLVGDTSGTRAIRRRVHTRSQSVHDDNARWAMRSTKRRVATSAVSLRLPPLNC